MHRCWQGEVLKGIALLCWFPLPSHYLIWDPEQRVLREGELPNPPHSAIVVADSFGLFEGKAYALPYRLHRFNRLCRKTIHTLSSGSKKPEPSFLLPPLKSLHSLLSRYRFAFPRLELRFQEGALRFGIWIRPLPPLYRELELEIYPDPDPRLFPERKGPDLPLLIRLQQGVPPGVELLLCDREGRIREGSRTTMFIYRKGKFLFPKPSPIERRDEELLSFLRGEGGNIPQPSLPLLPEKEKVHQVEPRYQGITLRILKLALTAKGIYEEVPLCPDDLTSSQVYLSNSLHGVIGVKRFAGVPLPEPEYRQSLQEFLYRTLSSL